jgi:hypothetical protein
MGNAESERADGEVDAMSLHEESRGSISMAVVLGLAFLVSTMTGCGSATSTASPFGGQGSLPIGSREPATPATGQSPGNDIPPGRSIAEGGGGPLNYTFREEWRRARTEALRWRSGAYLVTATGDFVNDDGIPSSWALVFVDKVPADAVYLVDIDPWGAITTARQVSGEGVSSFVGAHTARIPYSVIDSDKAVGFGRAGLSAQLGSAVTKDPRLALGFDEVDGSGPFWTYTLFDEWTGDYASVKIDALTGALIPTD